MRCQTTPMLDEFRMTIRVAESSQPASATLLMEQANRYRRLRQEVYLLARQQRPTVPAQPEKWPALLGVAQQSVLPHPPSRKNLHGEERAATSPAKCFFGGRDAGPCLSAAVPLPRRD